MNKNSIKVIKRKDFEAMANAKTQNQCNPKLVAKVSEKKVEHRLQSKMVDTVSNWISERRKSSRIEENAAIQRLRAAKPILSEI